MRRRQRFLTMLACVSLFTVASRSALGQAAPVVVDGSSTVYLISQAAQIEFHKVESKIKVNVGNHGTGGGFSRYLQGEVDIVDASRDAKVEESTQAKAKKLDWTRFLVGYDGITVVVNSKNTWVKSLTTDQLKQIFAVDGKIKTWKDLNPAWPDRRVVLYGPDSDSGTFEFFVEAILKTKEKRQNKAVQVNPDDNALVRGVAGDEGAIGYFGYAYFAANKQRLNAVSIDAGKGPVAPTPETILNKSYAPLARPLYIFVKNASLARPEVSRFVSFYLTNVVDLAKKGRYVPPTSDDVSKNREALSSVSAK